MRLLLSGIAALALIAAGAAAQGQGNGQGGNSNRPSASTQDNRGNANRGGGNSDRGGGNADRGPQVVSQARDPGPRDRGNSNGNRANNDRGPPVAAQSRDSGPPDRGNGGGNSQGNQNRNGNDRNQAAGRQADSSGNAANRGNGNAGGNQERRFPDARVASNAGNSGRFLDYDRRGLIDGCPPGLAKKYNGCMPPGQLKNQSGYRYSQYRPEWWGLSALGLTGSDYYYDDGYLVRLGRDGRIGGYIPLLGGALSIGNPWPSYYQPVVVPRYYTQYYGLGPDPSYRYANNVFYRVDPETAAITSIAAMLTGDNITVGQPMPAGYQVYNVPYGYRDRYYDTPNAYYRYSDGYIYQVDPETRLVAAAIELLL